MGQLSQGLDSETVKPGTSSGPFIGIGSLVGGGSGTSHLLQTPVGSIPDGCFFMGVIVIRWPF